MLLVLDLIALSLAGIATSAFIPIIQSKPKNIPQIVKDLFTHLEQFLSIYEFLFLLISISGLLLISRSLINAVIEKHFYLKLSDITRRLVESTLRKHYATPIERRIPKSNTEVLHGIHDSLNSLTVYVLGNLVIVTAEVVSLVLLLSVFFIWKPLITSLLIFFVFSSVLISYKFHIKKSQVLLANFSEFNSTCVEKFTNLSAISSELKLRNQFDKQLLDYVSMRAKLSRLVAIRQVQFGFPRLILESSVIIGGLLTSIVVWYTLNVSNGLVVFASLMIIGFRLQPAILRIQNGFQVMIQHKESSNAALELIHHYQKATNVENNSKSADGLDKKSGLKISNLEYEFEDGQSIFKKIDIEFSRTGMYLLKGENGTGKSTVLEIIAGQRRPISGKIEFQGLDFLEMTQEELGNLICILPQKPYFYEQTIVESLMIEDLGSVAGSKQLEESFRILEALKFDFSKHDLNSKMNLDQYLSEGEKQKIGLSRALIRKPLLLLLDEPVAPLDFDSRSALYDLLRIESENRLVLVVSHDDLFDSIATGVWRL
jgi:ABC-type multidrug transport system fused ATPase/permease subunit